jgi:hypothetical protein
MIRFEKFVYTPAGSNDVTLAIAACRAGGVGILNAELEVTLFSPSSIFFPKRPVTNTD